jgi:hypothetical protein
MSQTGRFAAYWVGFALLFVLLQLVIAQERPDGFGLVVLAVFALPVAGVLTWLSARHG